MNTDITTRAQAVAMRAIDNAPTLLEAMFWGWLLGLPRAEELYFAELEITDLVGYGNVPDDTAGEL